MITKLAAAALIVAAGFLATGALAEPSHLAGVPPTELKAGAPTTGTMMLNLRTASDTRW